ncbi:hypothetical protein [Acinetobacter sp. YH12205]|uniref:hypothetical protein n=1 Tax=Acinetobacter sp. YH12205 TaxID=2601141 RepID=UPI0015D32677|nr:hypothetical protein [Acinetobacter sp. YH12205]
MYRTNTIYLSVKRTAMPNGSVSQTKGAKRCQRNIIFDGVACQPFFYPFQLGRNEPPMPLCEWWLVLGRP